MYMAHMYVYGHTIRAHAHVHGPHVHARRHTLRESPRECPLHDMHPVVMRVSHRRCPELASRDTRLYMARALLIQPHTHGAVHMHVLPFHMVHSTCLSRSTTPPTPPSRAMGSRVLYPHVSPTVRPTHACPGRRATPRAPRAHIISDANMPPTSHHITGVMLACLATPALARCLYTRTHRYGRHAVERVSDPDATDCTRVQ